MTENNNSPSKGDDTSKKQEESMTLHRPKHIKKNNPLDLERSKSAPIEETSDSGETNEYLSSYNYYIYYNSIKPKDPRLPKPLYKPQPNLAYIKETQNKEDEEDDEQQEIGKDINNQIEDLNQEFNKFQLKENKNQSNYSGQNINENFFNDNYINKGQINNFNQANNIQTALNYYQGDIQNQNMNWNEQNSNLNYPEYNMGMGGMINMGQMNPFIGMDMGNIPVYMDMNSNQRINPSNNDQINKNTKNEKIFENNQMMQNPNNNLYNSPNFIFNNQNPMMPIYNQGIQMQMMNNIRNMNMMIPNNMNNMQYQMLMQNYQNWQNNINKYPKKNKNGENFIRKDNVETQNIEEIIENAIQLSKDHSGSRLVQKKYEESSKDIQDRIFEKFKPEILSLSKDIFGNYAIQKVLESNDKEKNNFILESLKGKIYDLSLHMYGCRVIQQLISVIDEKYLSDIILELKDHFAKLIEDQNGNHVIQKLIGRLKPGENNDDIYDVVYNNIIDLSKHQYGCRVIQTLLKQCNEAQIKKILEKIYMYVKELSEDQYGNYIIQYILENNKKNNNAIYEGLKGHIYDFSLHKYASNVIERALNYGNDKQRKNIIDEIIKQDDAMQDCILSMVKDKFGNYVAQKLIEFSDLDTRNNIIKRITSQSLKRRDGFSKHVINFIEKITGKKFEDIILEINQNTNNENNKKVKK